MYVKMLSVRQQPALTASFAILFVLPPHNDIIFMHAHKLQPI